MESAPHVAASTTIRLEHLSPVGSDVASRFRGVSLESNVQGWAYLEKFEMGVAEYAKIAEPTAKDDRWLGVCYFQMAEDQKAVKYLFRAAERGEYGARINLAHVLRFVERADESLAQLKLAPFDALAECDKVFYCRVLSMHEENNGNMREALRSAEEAWKRIQGLAEYAILAPAILAQLGVLHSRIGRAQRALWFLDRGLRMTEGYERQKVQLRRASALSALGRHHEGLAELEAVQRLELPPALFTELQMLFGEVALGSGALAIARTNFEACVAVSHASQSTYEEFISRLALAGIAGISKDLAQAKAHLNRAQLLIVDKSDRLEFRLREISLRLQTQDYGFEHALNEYVALDQEFEQMGLLKEQGRVRLHKAALLHSRADPRFLRVLDDLQELCVTLQNQAFLASEWLFLPDFRRAVKRSHSQLLGGDQEILEVRTLGEESLLLAGERLAIPLRRLVEVIAYLLEYKAVSLDGLLADVFPEQKPRSARSYFHQCRHQLKERVPNVEIEYDREARLYRLRSEIDIVWDVSEVRAGRKAGDFGSFLPSSVTDWTLTVDHGLDRHREPVSTAAA